MGALYFLKPTARKLAIALVMALVVYASLALFYYAREEHCRDDHVLYSEGPDYGKIIVPLNADYCYDLYDILFMCMPWLLITFAIAYPVACVLERKGWKP